VKRLGRVESVFEIAGRGAVIVVDWLSDRRVRNGDPIQLRAPGGCVTDTIILAVESLNQGPGKGRRSAFRLPGDVAKREIAEGDEVWVEEVEAPS
jgi:hypothetical protein